MEYKKFDVGTIVTPKTDAPFAVKNRGWFSVNGFAYVQGYLRITKDNYDAYSTAVKMHYMVKEKPFIAVKLVEALKNIGNSKEFFVVPQDYVEEGVPALDVNIKLADNSYHSWAATPFRNMKFFSKAHAVEFAEQLAEFHGTQVRLDFMDMSGRCNGNGTYIAPNYKKAVPLVIPE